MCCWKWRSEDFVGCYDPMWQKDMKDIDGPGYTYLGTFETDKNKEYLRCKRLILRPKLNGRNKIMAVNTLEVSVTRYGAGILKWNSDELKDLDRSTTKFMAAHGALYPKSDVNRIYLNMEMRGRRLITCEGCIRMEENNLAWYVRNSVEPLIEVVKAAETKEYNDVVNKEEFKQFDEGKEGNMEKWKNARAVREMPETVDEKETWNWLRKANLKVETEAMFWVAEEQAIWTNYVKHKIDKATQSSLCRMCDKKSETMIPIVSECGKLRQKEDKRRHDNVARTVHWFIWVCSCKHVPEGVAENEEVKIFWVVMIQCDREIKARKPDIVVVNKNERSCAIIDIAIPRDIRISQKEKEKTERYLEVKREIKRMWSIRSIKVIPVVVGSVGST